jgi:TatD DNase family protein
VIDFHCHIDLYPDPVKVLDEADARGTYVLAVTTTPKAWRGTRVLVGNRRRVRVALGLHPELVTQRHHEVALLCALIPEAHYIGEVGLDGSAAHKVSLPLQRTVLDRILRECALSGGRVISMHSRGAADEVLDILDQNPNCGLPILHWFSGTTRQLERAIARGCWFSVGPAMLRSRKGRDLAAAMPPDRLLTETDAPFARDGAEPLMPWQAGDCVGELSRLLGLSQAELAKQLLTNLRSVSERALALPVGSLVAATTDLGTPRWRWP